MKEKCIRDQLSIKISLSQLQLTRHCKYSYYSETKLLINIVSKIQKRRKK